MEMPKQTISFAFTTFRGLRDALNCLTETQLSAEVRVLCEQEGVEVNPRALLAWDSGIVELVEEMP